MIYPRLINGQLVADDQMVFYKEHMTQTHRILFLSGPFTGETDTHNLLMALDTISHEPIKLVITSPGGDLDSTFLFYDTMKMIQASIITIGRYCASAAALILAAGSERYLFPHAKVMLHLPAGQMGGDAKDFTIQHAQMMQYQEKIIGILKECGVKRSREQILDDIDRSFWLEPEQAITYGLADEIMTPELWQTLIQAPVWSLSSKSG